MQRSQFLRGLLAGAWLLASWLGAPARAQAQQKVQVVARTLEQSWPTPAGTTVYIRAEKATLQVRGWDRPTVQVTLRLSARHPDRAVAEQDLVAAQYRLQKSGSRLDLLNFFELPAGAPAVRADLRAEFTVWVPTAAAVQAVNAYGQTELADLAGRLRLEQSFGKIELRNLGGSLALVARYADVTATRLAADLSCEASKSQLQLAGVAGTCLVRNYYGSVNVQPAATGLRRLTIEADRSEVVVSAPQPELFDYQLSVQQGTLAVPPAYAAARKSTANRATLSTTPGAAPRPLIRASTSYAPLTLQTQFLSARF